MMKPEMASLRDVVELLEGVRQAVTKAMLDRPYSPGQPEIDVNWLCDTASVVAIELFCAADPAQEAGGLEETVDTGMAERGAALTEVSQKERIDLIRRKLLGRLANLASTNKTERGLPNEISHDQGWQGALELMKNAIEEEVK